LFSFNVISLFFL